MADTSPSRRLTSELSVSKSSLSSLNTDTSKSNQDVAEEMAVSFSKYVNFTVDHEEKKFNESVELMLTKLDEFFSLVDMIRSDTSLCLSSTLPDILAKCSEMEAIFDKIDSLEEFVSVVRDSVALMEEKVVNAEAELGTTSGLVKKLTSFVSMKKPRPRSASYVPPKIFSTFDFFHHSSQEGAEGSSSPPSSSGQRSSATVEHEDLEGAGVLHQQTS